MAAEHSLLMTRTFQVAEVKCYLCGATSGTIECEQGAASGPVLLQAPGETKARAVENWRQLRCARCGGATFLDESDVVTRRVEQVDWMDDRPRRGRPPKRLVEQRRRESEALGNRAA